jgi:O-6-methylguanine DNA methyltransferase
MPKVPQSKKGWKQTIDNTSEPFYISESPHILLIVQLYKSNSETVVCGTKIKEANSFQLSFAIDKNLKDDSRIEGDKELVTKWCKNYAKKIHDKFPLPLKMNANQTQFFSKFMKQLAMIPFGKSYSYSEMAIKVNNVRASRAIGNACHNNPFPLIVPCHRILAAGKKLGGFSAGLDLKKELLNFEGIEYHPM